MIKKDPCACWLVCDTNFSGAGVWCSYGINLVSGDDSFSDLGKVFHFIPLPFCILDWYYKWYHFSVHRNTTFGDPLKSYPGRLQFSPPFHQADQAAPEAQISLLSVAQRRSGILSYSWRTFLGSWPRSFSAAPFPIPVAPPYDPVGRSDR